MERTITLDGVEYKLVPVDETKESNRRTGYERVERGDAYFFTNSYGNASTDTSVDSVYKRTFDCGNAVNDEQLAEDRARRNRLLWQLERFSAMGRKRPLVWGVINNNNYYIQYDYDIQKLTVDYHFVRRYPFQVYFDSQELAEAAIKEFHDELIWFFTEYQDKAEFRV